MLEALAQVVFVPLVVPDEGRLGPIVLDDGKQMPDALKLPDPPTQMVTFGVTGAVMVTVALPSVPQQPDALMDLK